MGMNEDFKKTLGFLSIVPVKVKVELKDVAQNMWMFPFTGAVIAFAAAFVSYFFTYFFSNEIVAAVALFVLLLLTGFHHLDGLLDFGDAAMFRGDVDKRKRVMHDSGTGVGGFGLGFFVLLLSYLGLLDFGDLFKELIAAEASAKFSMVMLAYLGRPSHEGMGSVFLKAVSGNHRQIVLAFFLYVTILYFVRGGAEIMIVTFIFSLAMLEASNRLLGGVCGDVFGASNEIVRMLVLVLM